MPHPERHAEPAEWPSLRSHIELAAAFLIAQIDSGYGAAEATKQHPKLMVGLNIGLCVRHAMENLGQVGA